MTSYEDNTIRIGDNVVFIKGRGPLQRERRIIRAAIKRVEIFEMGLCSGRARLVGISPLRPRNWFHWDRDRGRKTTAVGIDHGRFLRPTVTPDSRTPSSNYSNKMLNPTGWASHDDISVS